MPNIEICAYLYVCIATDSLVFIRLHKKVDLLETKVNCMKDGRFMWMKIRFDLAKNGHHKLCGLGDRLIVVVRQ